MTPDFCGNAEVITRLQLYNDPEFNPVLVPQGPSGMFRLSFWFPQLSQGGVTGGDTTAIHDRILGNFLRHISADANGLSTALCVTGEARAAALVAACPGYRAILTRPDGTTATIGAAVV